VSEPIRELAQLIEGVSGFVVGERGSGALADFVRRRVERGGFAGIERYISYLRRHPDSEEWRHLLSRITIKESYLFRGRAQLDALADTILGEIADRRLDRRLRVWCAGCARGEEAATLAIVLADHPRIGTWPWAVLATDVDEAALAEARRGIYGRRAVSRVPPPTLERYFVDRDGSYELVSELRDRIEYRRLNLVEQPFDLEAREFDVIFLRNVLIYFRPELQRRVVEGVARALTPEGVLFLGPSESLLHLRSTLAARDLGECFCYRRPPPFAARGKPAPVDVLSGQGAASAAPLDEDAACGRDPAVLSPVGGESAPSFELRLEMLVGALEAGENQRARAGLATLRHEFPESAVVHALEGVALDRSGDRERAVLAYRAALYLAPEMDEIRFLLGRALEGLGRSSSAAREYRTALTGLGPAGGFMATILGRLGFPDHHQMSRTCREFIKFI
jgi:chemotaxis protein methyltransferase CheR